MKAKSIQGGSTDEIQAALLESMVDGFKPTLSLVFSSVDPPWMNFSAITEVLSAVAPYFGVNSPLLLQRQTGAPIMFSCVGRKVALGPLIGKEIDGIGDIFDAPMAGFFSYGEFGRATDGNHEYHNLTCCWLVMKEK